MPASRNRRTAAAAAANVRQQRRLVEAQPEPGARAAPRFHRRDRARRSLRGRWYRRPAGDGQTPCGRARRGEAPPVRQRRASTACWPSSSHEADDWPGGDHGDWKTTTWSVPLLRPDDGTDGPRRADEGAAFKACVEQVLRRRYNRATLSFSTTCRPTSRPPSVWPSRPPVPSFASCRPTHRPSTRSRWPSPS